MKRACDKLNEYICERSNFEDSINFLASPLTGLGIGVNRFQQIFLSQYKLGHKTTDRLAEAAWKIISRQGQRLVQNGKTIESPEENLAHMKTMADSFLTKQMPIFKVLLL